MDTYPVAWLDATMPDGQVKPDSPIYAVKCNPILDRVVANDLTPKRIDIEVGGKLVFLVEDLLQSYEADKIIEITECLGYRPEAPGIITAPGLRQNKSVHWLADNQTMMTLFDRLSPHLPKKIDGEKLAPRLSWRLNMYRYDKGDIFNPHIDGDWPGFGLSNDGKKMEEWRGLRSKISLILYLNGYEEGVKGGETVIYDEGKVKAKIAPKKGRALLFRHGHTKETVLHAGAEVFGYVPKYVARINVLYEKSNKFLVRDFFQE